ncbi:MAG: SigE family RNA polymerase sigma factor [Acidimicrobiales bacterium]|nr:SigE family RNA polymerase sigma factor [Acidimicrobiales bacterium]
MSVEGVEGESGEGDLSSSAGVAADPSFEELFEAEHVAMVRLAYLLVGSEAVAEEVVQDAFVSVFERRDRIDNPGGYLRRCVVNGARRVQRRRVMERRRPLPAPDAVDPDARELLDALAELPYRWRAVVVLRFYEGLSQQEIADALDMRLGTVKSSLHRGLAELRTVVER